MIEGGREAMEKRRLITMKPKDRVSIRIECEGRGPINITIALGENGKRYVSVQTEAGGCGTVADKTQLNKSQ